MPHRVRITQGGPSVRPLGTHTGPSRGRARSPPWESVPSWRRPGARVPWSQAPRRRSWRRRGRRAQVSAIATLLGLLLVVSVLANYLANQLPAQMSVNDSNRTAVVEDQLTRFSAELQALSQMDQVGAAVSQPVTLGSLGAPPFAPADGATVGPVPQGSKVTEAFILSSSAAYSPPTVGAAGGTTKGATCTTSSTSLTCSNSGGKVYWNFTAPSTSYSVTTSGGPYHLGFQTSGSTIAFTASSSSPTYIVLVGNNDTLTITIAGSGTFVRLWIFGNYDTVNFAAGSWSSSHVSLLVVGTHDSVSTGAMSMSGSTLTASFYGSNDTLGLGTTSSSNSAVNVFFTGFAPAKASASCPVDNLAAGTDSVTAGGAYSGNGKFNVTYNDSSTTSGSAPPSPWTATFAEPPPFACPFYTTHQVPVKGLASFGGAFEVTLRNTYIPFQTIGFDQGAIVTAQSGGPPLMLLGPQLAYAASTGKLTIWFPEFSNGIGTEAGTGTPVITARLASVTTFAMPETGYSLGATTSIQVTTPFAAAWMTYFSSATSPFVGDATCVPKTSTACTGPFSVGGKLATVYLNVTATAFSLQVATFGITLS